MSETDIRANLAAVQERIAAAARRAGRREDAVLLVGVSKTVDAERVRAAIAAGVPALGENRVQEAREKIAILGRPRPWHLIGHLQTNKVGKALRWADLIHSVDRPSLLAALQGQERKVPVFLQVNVSGEASKGGYEAATVEGAVAEARRTLEVRGLMTMAPIGAETRPLFRTLRETAERCGLRELSMGMTQDYEVAVEEGATHVRVGTAIFDGVLI